MNTMLSNAGVAPEQHNDILNFAKVISDTSGIDFNTVLQVLLANLPAILKILTDLGILKA